MSLRNAFNKRTITIFLVSILILSFAGCTKKNEVLSEQASESTEDAVYTGEFNDFNVDEYYDSLLHCVEQIQERTDFVPDIVLVLGSGLGYFADNIDVEAEIKYSEIEGFPRSTVQGHDGTLVFGTYKGKKLAIMKGRVHYYEGYDIQDVVLPIRVLHIMGADTLILTHAVGAINADYAVGDFVITGDHISSFMHSPLIGQNIDQLGERFVDMTDVYDAELREIAQKVADDKGITVHSGIYIQVPGPQYETPAEIRMFRQLGADTIGMSSAVEAIAARHMNMRVIGISQVTNMAAGMEDVKLSHEDIQAATLDTAENFVELISGLIEEMPDAE